MAIYNMHDAKTHLSRLAERAANGEEIVIARAGRPLARLVALSEAPPARKLGLWAGQVWTSDDLDAPLPEPVRKHFEGPGPEGEPTTVQLIQAGEIDLIVNTPHGSSGGGSARVDGYEIRTAAVMANIPCITTVQGLGAAVQGIEALRSGDVGVRSLQDWAARAYVRAWGQSVPAARRLARLAGVAFRLMRWPAGTGPNWQNHRFPGTSSFVVELAPGPLSARGAAHQAYAVIRLARTLVG